LEKEAELFATLANIGSKLDRALAILDSHTAQIAELKGQPAVRLQWLLSTDQRFSAIMAPYQPRPAT
jgi:hypothetical protein